MEIGITSQKNLNTVEIEKTRKYDDLLANDLSGRYKCKVNIIPYVMTCERIVTTYQSKYIKQLGISDEIEAYIQTRVLKKILEGVSFDYRRGTDVVIAKEA